MPGIRGGNARAARVARMKRTPYSRTTRDRVATVIQRKFRSGRRKPVGRMSSKVNKYNVEIKSITNPKKSLRLEFNAGSDADGPANSLCILSGLFGGDTSNTQAPNPGMLRGTGCDQLIGCWIQEAYNHSLKFTLDYNTLQVDGAGTFPSCNVEVIHGMVMNTGAKMGVDPSTMNSTAWLTAIESNVRKELHRTGFSADHLNYVEQNRRVKVLKRYTVRPKPSQAIIIEGTSVPTKTLAPPYHGQYKFPHNKMKTRLVESKLVHPDDPPPEWVPNSLWIPFTLILAPEITSATGYIQVETISKCYLRDA